MQIITSQEFTETFPVFSLLSDKVLTDMLSKVDLMQFPAGKLIYTEGDPCSAIAFILSGKIRVYKAAETGREITLYEIGRGETCILNASCILSGNTYPANAVSLGEGKMILIAADDFRGLMESSDDMRRFVFGIISRRLSTVMSLVEEIAFGKMDVRLKEYILEKAENGTLQTTHQAIAGDLGTSREVVSRLLKDFERKGFLSLSRNKISIRTS